MTDTSWCHCYRYKSKLGLLVRVTEATSLWKVMFSFGYPSWHLHTHPPSITCTIIHLFNILLWPICMHQVRMVFRGLLSAGQGGKREAKWTKWQTEGKKKHSKPFLVNGMFFTTPLRREKEVNVKNFILVKEDFVWLSKAIFWLSPTH